MHWISDISFFLFFFFLSDHPTRTYKYIPSTGKTARQVAMSKVCIPYYFSTNTRTSLQRVPII